MRHERSIKDILQDKDSPVVAIDMHGIFYFVNDMFTKTYGWEKEDLIGNLITMIMPSHMRDAHNFGFSRFLTTEVSKIQGKHLELPALCKDGTVVDAVHYIVGEKVHNEWKFAATIVPKS